MQTVRSSYLHHGGDRPLLGVTIPEQFAAVVDRHAEGEAVVSLHQGRRMSYQELAAGVDRLARGLLAAGFREASTSR